ncbi:hypothetical protein BROSI_A1207 [Candidatus Brocadia sinica JPN1]|uniref:Uncharacterized protein n=1 Tax=Candidatus Brocadia sinica JPN1 TaxID=1197129 RepID=A0ABQ0JVD3_9BACT|nr:hypothetical protein BROSI_A1207 [Candidatus Brocadia sinica JPN1]
MDSYKFTVAENTPIEEEIASLWLTILKKSSRLSGAPPWILKRL